MNPASWRAKIISRRLFSRCAVFVHLEQFFIVATGSLGEPVVFDAKRTELGIANSVFHVFIHFKHFYFLPPIGCGFGLVGLGLFPLPCEVSIPRCVRFVKHYFENFLDTARFFW